MTPAAIKSAHHATILRNNRRFVHWLAPLDQAELDALLDASDYARQCLAGDAVLFGYDAHGAYRHKRVDWLCERLDHVFYIDRIIIGPQSRGRGPGAGGWADVFMTMWLTMPDRSATCSSPARSTHGLTIPAVMPFT